jgi:hypothetical protein
MIDKQLKRFSAFFLAVSAVLTLAGFPLVPTCAG